jgi:hypothetical protein
LVAQIANKSGVELRRRAGTGQIQGGEWEPVLDVDGLWKGRISIQAKDSGSIENLRKVHSLGVEADGLCHLLEVECHFVGRGASRGDVAMNEGAARAAAGGQ